MRNAGLALHSSNTTSPHSRNQEASASSSSSILQHLRHPIHKNKRKSSDGPPHDNNALKRARSETKENSSGDDIILDESRSTPGGRQVTLSPKRAEDRMDFADIVNFFRLDPKTLGRKKEYQILYFPMTEPLTPAEQLARQDVHSTKIC